MRTLLLAGLMFQSAAGPVIDGERFGPARPMTCIWFSNFENSRFTRCVAEGRSLLADDAVPSFAAGQRARLDEVAGRLSRTRQRGAPSGVFQVRLIGRLSTTPRTVRRYLGDAFQTVRVEKVIGVRLIEQ